MADGWLFGAPVWWLVSRILETEQFPPPIEIRAFTGNDTRARLGLERLGVLRSGRVDADVEAALRLLARPQHWVGAIWLPDPGAELPARALAAGANGSGVLAVQGPAEPGATRVHTLGGRSLTAAVLDVLPPSPHGAQSAVTVPIGQSRREPEDDYRERSVFVSDRGGPSKSQRDHRAATELLGAAHSRSGQIVASARSTGGVRRSAVLRWFDNNGDGRYLVTEGQRNGRQHSLAIAPADAQDLGQHIDALLKSVSR